MKGIIKYENAEQILNNAELYWNCTIQRSENGFVYLWLEPINSIDPCRIFIGSNIFSAAGWCLRMAYETNDEAVHLAGRLHSVSKPENP